ncbi:MAG: hypothetical protein QOF37_1431 [Thermoleophilaceae bacterium]|jgi:hypothetical protein|nr:hypothetical protein [Thermoleophilaceae bacterium]
MANHGDNQLKRIVLPSGKTIEVVYFESLSPEAATDVEAPLTEAPKAQPQKGVERDLHVCPDCTSDLVYPVAWEEADETHWSISLRCPNCQWAEEGVYPQDDCDRFDDELERGTDALTRDYKRLMTANLADEIERFAHALDVDAILPMDF